MQSGNYTYYQISVFISTPLDWLVHSSVIHFRLYLQSLDEH